MNSVRRPRWIGVVAAASLLVACGGGDDGGGEAVDPDTGGDDAQAEGDGDESGGAAGTIRVAYLQTGSSAPMYLTADVYAQEVGIDVEMTRVSSGQEALTGVATGQFDVGFAGIGSASYNAHNEGLPVSFVAPMHAGYVEDYFILSSTVAGDAEEAATLAEDLSDFAGESFAVNAPGVVTEALLGQALERAGLDYGDVVVEYIPFPDQVPALANGGVVGAINSEPFPTIAENDGAGYRPWETPDEPPSIFTGIIYNDDWAAANPELAEGYMEAYAMAAEDLDENGWDSEQALAVVQEYTGAEPEVLRETRQHHIPPDLSVDFDVVAGYQQFYLDQGALDYEELVDDEELWDFSWRDAVLGG